jgi:hypothetical protein
LPASTAPRYRTDDVALLEFVGEQRADGMERLPA